MLVIKEVVATLQAKGFANADRLVTGRVVKIAPDGPFDVEVDEAATGVDEPKGPFTTEEAARSALIAFWKECDRKLAASGMPGWRTRVKL